MNKKEKKILILCLLIACIGLTGCKKEKGEYEHYDLKEKDINSYVYHSDERGMEEYVLADLTTGDMTITTGFYYKVKENDYILLETLESSDINAYKNKSTYQFYNNKLYGVGNGSTPMYFEIELNGKNSHIEEKTFTWNEKSVGPVDIKNIENNYITFYGYTSFENEAMVGRYFKCSLKDYKCEMQEDM